MITKKTLLTYISDLDESLFILISRVQTLEKELAKLKEEAEPKPKRSRGRPRKNA